MEYMKQINMVITENMYASLITCYSRQDKMEAAEGVLDMLASRDQRVHWVSYVPLLCAYAQRGMVDKMLKVRLPWLQHFQVAFVGLLLVFLYLML